MEVNMLRELVNDEVLIDLGSVTTETKGIGQKNVDSFGQPLDQAGISDD
jgi:hypothetical protein